MFEKTHKLLKNSEILKLLSQVRVKTNSGKEFLIDWKHRDLLSFKKCHEACIEQAHGDMFEYKPFNEVNKLLVYLSCPLCRKSVFM